MFKWHANVYGPNNFFQVLFYRFLRNGHLLRQKKTTVALTESSSRLRSAKSIYLGPLVSVRSQSLRLLHLVYIFGIFEVLLPHLIHFDKNKKL